MNKREQAQFEHNMLQEIRASNRTSTHYNCIRINLGNKKATSLMEDPHEWMKCQVVWELRRRGHKVMTEVIFLSGFRADIVDLTAGVIYEILLSETDEQFKEKLKTYPTVFEVRKIRANQTFSALLLD